MSKKFMRIAAVFAMVAVMLVAAAGSAFALSANVVMRVSRTAQDSIISVGEDLTIDVELDGVAPAACRWYFGDELLADETGSKLMIRNAQIEDAGTYRFEAYDAEGKMLVSMEFAVRVVDKALPKSGDDTLGLWLVGGAMALFAAAGSALIIRRNRCAA